MTRISPDWLDAAPTKAVMDALAPARPLFVGGCVRDALMGRGGGDVDIAVASPPEETMRLAENAGLSAVPTGVEHGVVMIVADGIPFEAATLRRDVETDGRRAVVAYTDRVDEDAARRDFTMNALYADAAGVVIDPLGGLEDLRARRLRFIGAPEARIREDYLRILRFFRFQAQFEIDTPDAEGQAACLALRGGLAEISAERVGAEMRKLLAAPDPEPALTAMGPILTELLPGAGALGSLVGAEATLGLPPDPLRRLAALGGDVARLRLSRAEVKQLASIRSARALPAAEAAYRHGAEAALSAAAIGDAGSSALAEIAKGAAARFPVSAQDLLDAGEAPGPALGERLRAVESDWIASDFTLSRAELLDSERGQGSRSEGRQPPRP